MFTKMSFFLIVILLGLLAFFRCREKNSTEPGENGDAISIKSVTPESGIIPGIVTDFDITVDYELASKDSGKVMVGFNTDEVGRFAMISDATALVVKGSGEHQFNVSTVPKDLG